MNAGPQSDQERNSQRVRSASVFGGLSDFSKVSIGVAGSVVVILTLVLVVVYRSQVWRATIFLISSLIILGLVGILIYLLAIEVRRQHEKKQALQDARRNAELDRLHFRAEQLKAVQEGRVAAQTDAGELLLRNSESLWFRCPAVVSDKKDGAYSGNLFVTSMRIVFACGENPLEIPIGDVNAVKQHPDGLHIIGRTSGRTQSFGVGDAELLAAHIARSVRAFHRQIDVGFERDGDRQIPQDVKTAVWQRDGGKCVGCGAADYLEFDHIIPHAKGGANSVQNVQLLCRRCNLKKCDAI